MTPFVPTSVDLKNGTSVLIREATPQDAEMLLACIKAYILNSEFIPKLAQEITLTPTITEEWIQSFIEKDNSMLLVALHQNEIIGNIDLTGSARKIMEHTAMVGMGMLAEWRNFGLGTKLMEAAIAWAKENPILELLWLQVYTQNSPGVNLYRKMGFSENGLIKNYFKHDGIYYDSLSMTLNVKS